MESIIGAIYSDLGHNKTNKFVINQIINNTNTHIEESNYKSKILEWSHQKNKQIKFINTSQKGPDHKKKYLIELFLEEEKISESWGSTIKQAEQKSSEIAYKIVN